MKPSKKSPRFKTLFKKLDRSLKIIGEFSEFLKLLDLRETNILKIMIVRFMIESTNADFGGIIEKDEETGEIFYSEMFVYKSGRIVTEDFSNKASKIKFSYENSPYQEIFKKGSIVQFDITTNQELNHVISFTRNSIPQKLIYIPIFVEDKVKYIIEIGIKGTKKIKSFTESYINILTVLSNIASAIFDNASLFNKAILDNLTGLYNIHYFKSLIKDEISKSIRFNSKLSLGLIDIDNFKSINDTYGHQVGDEALKFFSLKLKQHIRSLIDIPARYGGDEFIIAFLSTDKDTAFKICERIRMELNQEDFVFGDLKIRITPSIGISSLENDKIDRSIDLHNNDTLFKKIFLEADTALYNSKKSGRNMTTIYHENLDQIKEVNNI